MACHCARAGRHDSDGRRSAAQSRRRLCRYARHRLVSRAALSHRLWLHAGGTQGRLRRRARTRQTDRVGTSQQHPGPPGNYKLTALTAGDRSTHSQSVDLYIAVFVVMWETPIIYASHPDTKNPKPPPQYSQQSEEHYQRIGSALARPDGGYTIQLSSVPREDVLVMRPPKPDEKPEGWR